MVVLIGDAIYRLRNKEDVAAELAEAEQVCCGMSEMPEQNVLDSARLYKAYKEYVYNNGIGAISSRCWPDFFVEFGSEDTKTTKGKKYQIKLPAEKNAKGALEPYEDKTVEGK